VIVVVGASGDRPVVRFPLAHGADPVTELHARGWVGTVTLAHRPAPGALEIRYAVTSLGAHGPTRSGDLAAVSTPAPVPGPVRGPGGRGAGPVLRDPGLSHAEVSGAYRHQRVAAYAVVRSVRGLLVTELSARTNAAGLWNLPGGGVEADEQPPDAVRREVLEETGQVVDDVRLLTVLTAHWVGRSPRGRVEDFHAVRLFCTASCPTPTDPVVHDVDGSTSAARWVPVERLGTLPLATSVPVALAAAGVATGGGGADTVPSGPAVGSHAEQAEDDEEQAHPDDQRGSGAAPVDVDARLGDEKGAERDQQADHTGEDGQR
jgi:8-oxo-dGTP pyrophosphatase MutT (NUDIX family)